MGRYIDADKLLTALPDDLPYKASVKRVLTQAPTADVVEVRHGGWIHSERGFDVPRDYECSLCHSPDGIKHFYRGEPHYAFCPNCGAKMDGERKEQ